MVDLEKAPGAGEREEPVRRSDAEGCLAVAVRLPVRIVVLVLVLPVRMAWDVLVVAGRFLRDTVLRPVGRALAWLGRALFVWPLVGLWRYVVVPVAKGVGWLGNVLLVVPALWVYRWVLTPVGHALGWFFRGVGAVLATLGRGLYAGLAWLVGGLYAGLTWFGRGVYCGLAWLARYLVVVPAAWFYAWVLTPIGHLLAWCGRGLAWCGRGVLWCLGQIVTGIGAVLYWTVRILVVLPALAVWRWVLVPVGRALAVVGRELLDALGHAWRIAGHLSRAVGRALAALFRWTVAEPARWVYRSVLTPVGHAVRDTVLRPLAEAARSARRAGRQALGTVRLSVRQARADLRRTLFGEPVRTPSVDRREPSGARTRTLEKRT
ncbi:hypothetical protein NGM36_10570 [Streptomyces mutabilis]|uniref:hypothetical protein n=1 Tax=Streptomyces mutabilis TaxID=67332 RepID=UPI0022BA2351|nr:hypothetical protein [Streptomyces mutabilis]MCZ9350230.1 hypothetical protein [Streptomyces mutabilis]